VAISIATFIANNGTAFVWRDMATTNDPCYAAETKDDAENFNSTRLAADDFCVTKTRLRLWFKIWQLHKLSVTLNPMRYQTSLARVATGQRAFCEED
jgi:hypothetical protein